MGAPTPFVSHARKYRFADLLATVEAFAAKQPEPERVYVWLDIFTQYQHWIGDVGTPARICNWDVVFELTIAHIGHTCFVLSPWNAPLPLQRAWMLWEALATLMAKRAATLSIEVPPVEAASLETALTTDFASIKVAISKVDSRKAGVHTLGDPDRPPGNRTLCPIMRYCSASIDCRPCRRSPERPSCSARAQSASRPTTRG